MQQRYADRLDGLAEEFARHAIAAEVWPETVRHALRAGRRANSRSAWQAAIGFLEQVVAALAHLPRTPETIAQAIAARLELRIAVVAIGDVPRMMNCLDEAKALTEEAGDTAGAALIDIRRCMGLSMLGEIAQAVEAGERALVAAQATGHAQTQVAASFALGQALYWAGALRRTRSVLEASLEPAREGARHPITGGPGNPPLLLMTCLARTLCLLGDKPRALALAHEAGHHGAALQRSFDRAEAAAAIGTVELASGRVDAAIAVLEAGLELARANEHWLVVPMIALALGPAYAAAGDWTRGAALLEQAIRRCARHGLVTMGAQCRFSLLSMHESVSSPGLHEAAADLHGLARRHGFRFLEEQARGLLRRLSGELVTSAPHADGGCGHVTLSWTGGPREVG